MGDNGMGIGIVYFPLCRDGSAVELQGLCYSTVNWLAKLYQKGIYPHAGVKIHTESSGRAK